MIPVHLELRNFFSHRHSEIDFTKFESALLIGNTEGDYDLSNGSGKSAVFESILWCLFNKARVAAMNDIILWGEEACAVTMKFLQDDVLYRVKRSRSRVSNQADVSFEYLSDDDDWIDISGSTARLTNDKIISILKFDYKTFINSAYFRQNDISEFAESDPSRKKEILKSIIDLSKWDDYEREAKVRRRNIKTSCEVLEAKIQELDIDEIELAKNSVQLRTLKSDLETIAEKNRNNSADLEKMRNKYQELKQNLDTDQWDKIVLENKKIDLKIEKLSSKEGLLLSAISKIEKSLSPMFLQKQELEAKISEITVDDEIEQKLKKVRDSLVVYRSNSSTAKSLIEMLERKNIDDEVCNICGQDISEELHNKLSHQHNEEKEKYKKEIIFSDNKIEECNALIKQYENIQRDNKRFSVFQGRLKTLSIEIKMNTDLLTDKIQEHKDVQTELSNLNSIKKNNISVLNSLKNDDFQELHKSIDSMKNMQLKYEKEIAEKNREIGVLSQKRKDLQERIDLMKKEKEDLLKLSKSLAAYDKLCKLLGKNGIQTILLNAVIEDLEKTANQILASICNEPLSILLETQRVGSDGVSLVDTLDLTVKKDGINQNFKSLSGGEQFRISLSLRIALSEISSRHGGSSLEFLLLDEINSPLDRHGTENLFVNVIRSLENKYKIMVITHNDSLKEKFINVVDVTKINGESTAYFAQK